MALVSLVFMGLLAGLWWALIVYVTGTLVFFGLGLETRILCSHCPYWASDSKLLNCWAYPNTYKFWRYRPGPMNNIEKLLLILFFAFLAFFPVVMTAYGIWLIATSPLLNNLFTLLGIIGITTGTLLAGLQFFYVLQFYFCSRCINFSCPFNRVSTDKMKAYLQKNDVMKRAFETAKYKKLFS